MDGRMLKTLAVTAMIFLSVPEAGAGLGNPDVPDMVDAAYSLVENILHCVFIPWSEPIYSCILAYLNYTIGRILDDL